MKSLSARRIIPACVVSAAALAAFVAPGSASAALSPTLGAQCSGLAVQEAAGSSLQAVAQQQVWNVKFNTSGASGACSGKQGDGKKPEIKYISTSSGKGFNAWNTEHLFAKDGFIGTDNTVNPTEKGELEALGTGPGTFTSGKGVLTFPVAQSSVAIIINLGAGCSASSTSSPNQLALNDKTLEEIYTGAKTKWSEITEDGDTLTGTCPTTISPVVRKDASGTTHIFKRFLNWSEPNPITFKGPVTLTWNEASELGHSTLWPAGITPLEGEKNSGLITAVEGTAGALGYAVMSEAREAGFTGGTKSWALIENSDKKGKIKYSDPSTNGENAAAANSNCKKTVYTNGKASFPPPSVDAAWNEVTTEQFSKTYAICGLTYDLALANYAAYETAWGTSQGEAADVADYLNYVTAKKGGQKELAGHDYLELPAAVRAKAEQGISLIEWTP